MQRLMRDLGYAFRQMWKSAAYTLITVLTLSLGVGATTAIFSVVENVVLRPLPFNHPERIFFSDITDHGSDLPFISLPSFRDMRASAGSFAAFAAVTNPRSVNLETPSGPQDMLLVQGSGNFFDVFAVRPLLGRTFQVGEDLAGNNKVAVLSYEAWTTYFGGNPSIVGENIHLDGVTYQCVGVMPSGFRYPLFASNAIYTPLNPDPHWENTREVRWLMSIARLKLGVSPQQAEAEMNGILSGLGHSFPDSDGDRHLHLIDINSFVNQDNDKVFWALTAVVAAVLMISCLNGAGLLLARAVKREQEFALRAALGASRPQMIRQLLAESLLLAAMSATGGILLSALLLRVLRAFLVDAIQRGADIEINWQVLLAAVLVAVLASFTISILPTFQLSRANPYHVLKATRGAGAARAQRWLRSAFIVAQVSLSLALLMMAGTMLQVINSYRKTDLGFSTGQVLATEIDLSSARYQGRDIWAIFYRPLLERVTAIHGVRAAGLVSMVPVQMWGMNMTAHVAGQPPFPKNEAPLTEVRYVSPGYYDVMGIHLNRGQMLSPSADVASASAHSIVVNQAFMNQFIPSNLDPVGQRVDDHDKAEDKSVIVGVVSDVKQDLTTPTKPQMDFLYTQVPPKDDASILLQSHLVLRVDGDPKAILPQLRQIFTDLDPTLPFRTPETMDEIISDQIVMQRMEGWLFGIFAALATSLAVIGIYGLISHEVELGTREIGIRMALGSTRQQVINLIMSRVFILLVVGFIVGGILTALAKKMIGTLVILQIHDGYGMFALISSCLLVSGILAAFLPALRAASIDPTNALRAD